MRDDRSRPVTRRATPVRLGVQRNRAGISALTLRRVMFQNPPVDESIRADLHTLVRHPPRTH